MDVVYSETGRDRDGKGYVARLLAVVDAKPCASFVEFENGGDLKTAVDKLNDREFKGATVSCTQDVSGGPPIHAFDHVDLLMQIRPQIQEERPMDKTYRQRSPPGRGRYGAPGADEFYDRSRPPPRPYSPRGYNRERSPRGRPDDYYGRADYGRRTPPRGDPYGPPPPRREPYGHDPYDRAAPPPPPRGYNDPYARNGDPYAARPRSPPRAGYGGYGGGYGGYDDRRYW